jgi:hypothetical protein
VGQPGPDAGPVEGAVVGGENGGPLARIPEEETPPARAARGGGHAVVPVKEFVSAAQDSEVGFDIGESNGGVRNQIVEVLHDHLLAQNRQVTQRAIGEAPVRAPVEGRAGVGVFAQAMQRPALILLELAARPMIPLAQSVAQRQDLQDDLRAHRLYRKSSPAGTTAGASAATARSPPAGRW